jgi:exopolysaccharide production protein ExoZ
MDRIWSIQYLRALAALAVVVFHSMTTVQGSFDIGAAGVDIFFVISGFIMASLTFGREASPGLFLWRRAIRIVPVYWLATLAAAAILAVKPTFFYKGDGSIENTALSLLFFPHESAAGGRAPVIEQGWTLEFEVFFYFLCALALLWLPQRNRLKILCGVLVLLAAIGLLLPGLTRPWGTYTSQLLLEFVGGIALAAAWRQKLLQSATLGAAAMLAGFAAFALMQAGVLPQTGQRALDWGLPAFLIVAGALAFEGAGRVPRSNAGALLGDASYSLYLTHTFVLAVMLRIGGNLPLWAYLLASIGGSILVAIASYQLVEKPAMAALKPLWKRPSVRPSPSPAQG